MQNISIYYSKGKRDDFICRVLNQFSCWGIHPDSIVDMLEKCANNIERLTIIENCIKELSKLHAEPDRSTWLGESLDLIKDASIAVECRNILEELDEIKSGYCMPYCDILFFFKIKNLVSYSPKTYCFKFDDIPGWLEPPLRQ